MHSNYFVNERGKHPFINKQSQIAEPKHSRKAGAGRPAHTTNERLTPNMVATVEVPPLAPDFDEPKRDIFPLRIRSKIQKSKNSFALLSSMAGTHFLQ
jgi:hypothetical protein